MTRTNRQKKLRKSNRENCGRKVPYVDKVTDLGMVIEQQLARVCDDPELGGQQ